MFRYWQFHRKLTGLEREQRKTYDAYRSDIANAKKRGEKPDKIYEIESLAMHEDHSYDEEIQRLHSRYLLVEARRMMIPTPDWEDETAWEGPEYGPKYLTKKGIIELRSAVRAEKKVRREQVLMWVPVIGAITGLIGTAIGLLAFLTK